MVDSPPPQTPWGRPSCKAVHLPTLPVPRPNSPGVFFSVSVFDALPPKARGTIYIILFTDHFSRRAICSLQPLLDSQLEEPQNTGELFYPCTGYPSLLLSDTGLRFCAQLSTTVYKGLDIDEPSASAYHQSETVAQMWNVITRLWLKFSS